MGFFWMGLGISSVVYGLRGERVPGKGTIGISDTDSNSISTAERVAWLALGVGAIVVGFLDLYARFQRA